MYRNAPKVIFKVELQINNCVKIDLLLLNNYFNEKFNYRKSFFSDDLFMIESAGFFSVFKSKSLYLPRDFKTCINKSISLMFDTEEIRYEFLRKFNRALLEWSDSSFWKGFNKPSDTRIIYNKNIWILF